MTLKKKRRALCGARRFSSEAARRICLPLSQVRAAARNQTTPRTPRKKIPALRRANDTSFNVSERSANRNRVSGNGTTLLLTATPVQR
jgi:hypothetical protein